MAGRTDRGHEKGGRAERTGGCGDEKVGRWGQKKVESLQVRARDVRIKGAEGCEWYRERWTRNKEKGKERDEVEKGLEVEKERMGGKGIKREKIVFKWNRPEGKW